MNTTPETLSAYHLAYDAEQNIVDERTNTVFDRETYSRMKYGDTAATKAFATDVANVLIDGMPGLVEDPAVPEFLVAYKAVPPACFYLSRFCLDMVNEARAEHDNEPGRLIHVYKSRVAATDYAAASHEARQKELDGIGFSLEGRRLRDKPVVILDDIKITGSAERKMLEVVAPEDPAVIALGYIATFNEAQAATSPSVERDLNLSVINGINDLLPSIETSNFDLNIRTLKMILSSCPSVLMPFLEKIPEHLLEDIVRGTVDTGVDFVNQYALGHQIASRIQHERNG